MNEGGRSERWERARRVLAVRLDGMGDLLMTAPALRALKEAVPGRHLTLLTSEAGAQAASLLPFVDEVITYRSPWMKATAAEPDPQVDLQMASRLAGKGFDAAVIFTVYSQSPLPAAFLLHLAGIPLRLAYCRENPYHLLSDWEREAEPETLQRHEVRRHLDLVATVAGPSEREEIAVRPRESARRSVSRLLRDLRLAGRSDWFAVHVGATAPSRRYPPEFYGEAVRLLAERHGLTPVFTGRAQERELIEKAMSACAPQGIDLSGRLDLHELAALLDRAPLLLSNNTGPVHIAAGVGTPVVDLYALTNPQHTPWGVPSRVLFKEVSCRNCYSSVCPQGHHLCLRGVRPDEVAGAVLDLLAQAGGSSEGRLAHAAAR